MAKIQEKGGLFEGEPTTVSPHFSQIRYVRFDNGLDQEFGMVTGLDILQMSPMSRSQLAMMLGGLAFAKMWYCMAMLLATQSAIACSISESENLFSRNASIADWAKDLTVFELFEISVALLASAA